MSADSTNEWQPIETAPKDGTLVLLWDGYAFYLCSWDEDEAEWVDGSGFHSGNLSTHWMPPPKPPEQSR